VGNTHGGEGATLSPEGTGWTSSSIVTAQESSQLSDRTPLWRIFDAPISTLRKL
jgi:hypothetical protein